MKSCSQNRKLIAWLAVDALDRQQERALRAHVETCAECRRYLDQVSHVTNRLSAVEIRSDIQSSESFHQRVVGGLPAQKSGSRGRGALLNSWDKMRVLFSVAEAGSRSVGSRVMGTLVWPVLGASALAIAAWAIFLQRPNVPLPHSMGGQSRLIAPAESDFEPTISNYQMVANRSLDKLDELLTRQANSNPSPVTIYTLTTLSRAAASD